MSELTIISFPFAGGTGTAYVRLAGYLHKNISFFTSELPGRGMRYGKELLKTFNEAKAYHFDQTKSILKKGDSYAMFGHSLGGLFLYELYPDIVNYFGKEPEFIVISGSKTPCSYKQDENTFCFLNDQELKEYLYNLGGIPEELYREQDIFDFYLPILRADLGIVDNYFCNTIERKFKVPLAVLSGKKDLLIKQESMYDWKIYTESEFLFYDFEGNHFFINSETEEVASIINQLYYKYHCGKKLESPQFC